MARQVRAPTLLLWSERAGFLDEGMVARYAEAFPDFRAVPSTAGHYIPRERPGEFCRAVLAFLDR
jgi:pimeloyl-ACP methyl ester carboxylesterase